MSDPSSRPPSDRVWVFGYGSLASPVSIARTIGRPVSSAAILAAGLDGYGRRWNYGSMNLRGDWDADGARVVGGVVISLGLAPADDEQANGVIFAVSPDELAALDWRERDYERTDVSDRVAVEPGVEPLVSGVRVVTYVPRPSAVERYLQARDERRAAVRRSYWDLVHAAFGELGGDHLDRFRRTPDPDVPIADVVLTTPLV